MKLKDKVTLVTGGASGIGREIARLFGREGAQVVVADLNGEGASQVGKEVGGWGQACDVTQGEAVNQLIKDILSRYGRVDILVNNAGCWTRKTFLNMQPQDWQREFRTNYYSVLYCTHAVLPSMIQQRSGNIINMGSIAGRSGPFHFSIYAAAKNAIAVFTKAIAHEMGPYGIRANCICPGFVATPAALPTHERMGRGELEAATPLGRLCRPEEVARLALFLASDDSEFITGQSVVIDGGYLGI